MKTKKKTGPAGWIIRIILILVLLILVALGALTVNYLLTITDPQVFLPASFRAYIQIHSLKTVYDDLFNLEAMDVALSGRDMAPIRRALTEFRGQSISRNPLFRELLNLPADVVLDNGREMLAVFDLGWRSVLTRLVPALGGAFSVSNLTPIKKEGRTVFRYRAGENSVFVCFADNVLLLALKEQALDDAWTRLQTGDNLKNRGDPDLLKRLKTDTGQSVRFLADTQPLLSDALGQTPIGPKLLGNLSFPNMSVISAKLDDKNLKLELSTALDSPRDSVKKVLQNQPSALGILSYLPDDVSLVSAVNLGDFRDLYALALEFTGSALDDKLREANEMSKMVLGLTVDELLFNWIGPEIGAFMTSRNGDPVIFCKFKDRGAFDSMTQKLLSALVVTGDSSIVLDGVRLTRVRLPDFLQGLLELFGVSIPEGFYVAEGDYVFLSLNAENLASVVNGRVKGSLLVRDEAYKRLSESVPNNTGLFVYYDLDRSVPFFLRADNKLTQILKLYGKGLVALYPQNGEWDLRLAAKKTDRETISPYPGFPVRVDGLSGDVRVCTFSGGSAPWLVYVRGGTLYVADISQAEAFTNSVDEGTVIVPDDSKGAVGFFAYSPRGTLYRFDAKAQPVAPYPRVTEYQNSFEPFVMDGKLVLFSRPDKKIVLASPDGTIEQFPFVMPSPLQSPPAFSGNFRAFYPRSFGGKVYVTDEKGQTLQGWPAAVDGISAGSPVFARRGGNMAVYFLTQNGQLYGWTVDGSTLPGFPVKLDGVYYRTPAVVTGVEGGLIVLSEDGTVRMVSFDGKVVQEQKIGGLNGKDGRVLLKDVNRDGEPEVVIYGDRNTVHCLFLSLNELGGFPVNGNTLPQFCDLNQDGRMEMVTAGVDGTIHAYTLNY